MTEKAPQAMNPARPAVFLEKAVRIFWRLISHLVLFCFSTMLFIMILQVLFRYVLKISVPWTDEAARSLFVWEIFLGSALAQRGKSHIRITVFIDRLQGRWKRWIETGTEIFEALILIVILAGAFKMMTKTYGILLSTIPVSFTYVYLPLAIGAGLMLMLTLKHIGKSLRQPS